MELTLTEIKPLIKYIIRNNSVLQQKGQFPVSVCLEGPSGIGKSSLLDQSASELNANYIKLSLSNIAEPSDLVGYPIKEHYVCKEDECKWIPAELLEAYAKSGWELTEETRMGYAIPAWLKQIDPSKPTILNLDDFTRSTPAIMQAVMEIINRQEYISWKLPLNSTVVLSSNPDDGSFSVASLDDAQKSRYATFTIKFNKEAWAKWAEENNIDGRAINFLLQYGDELMNRKDTKIAKVNARNYTMFANIISGIPDWSKPENLALILQIASGCFLDEDNITGGLFTTFIANKLDKLISPEDLVSKDWKYVKSQLENQLYDSEQYRSDIASIITTRFVNYSLFYFSKAGAKSDLIINRILDIVSNDKVLLTEDLLFSLIKTLNKKYPGRCTKLILDPRIVKKLI